MGAYPDYPAARDAVDEPDSNESWEVASTHARETAVEAWGTIFSRESENGRLALPSAHRQPQALRYLWDGRSPVVGHLWWEVDGVDLKSSCAQLTAAHHETYLS